MPEGMFELTSFQRDLLVIAAEKEKPSGQEIKDEIEGIYETEITHGRLYPNLDTLVEKGYIDKGAIDRRTNFYRVNDRGMAALRDRREWQDRYLKEAESELVHSV